MHQNYCPRQILGQILEVHLVYILTILTILTMQDAVQKFKMQISQCNIRFKDKLSRCSISIIWMQAPFLFEIAKSLYFSMHSGCCQKALLDAKKYKYSSRLPSSLPRLTFTPDEASTDLWAWLLSLFISLDSCDDLEVREATLFSTLDVTASNSAIVWVTFLSMEVVR